MTTRDEQQAVNFLAQAVRAVYQAQDHMQRIPPQSPLQDYVGDVDEIVNTLDNLFADSQAEIPWVTPLPG